MTIHFEVTSRKTSERSLPKPQVVRTRWLLQLALPTLVGGLAIFVLVTVLGRLGLIVLFFYLLPACATVITEFRRRHNNPRQLLLVGSLAFLYFSRLCSGLLTTLETAVRPCLRYSKP